jgi:hypothetical protein
MDEMERCHHCGMYYETVYRIPDKIWGRIASDKNLLCPSCCDHLARLASIELYWGAEENEYPGEHIKKLEEKLESLWNIAYNYKTQMQKANACDDKIAYITSTIMGEIEALQKGESEG